MKDLMRSGIKRNIWASIGLALAVIAFKHSTTNLADGWLAGACIVILVQGMFE